MALLRLVGDATKPIPLGEDGDYIVVKSDISKRVFNRLLGIMPRQKAEGEDFTIEDGLNFQQSLFDIFVVGWSLDVPATLDNYLDLSTEAAEAVDAAVAKHFESLTLTKDESTKSD